MDYRLDTNVTPNKITFTITESPFGEGMTTGGLTKMVGDELVVRYSPEGGDAPNNFDAKADDDYHTFHLKKQ